MENNLNSTQNVSNTASPQPTGESPAASDSSEFQKSADATALNQYKAVKVDSTGQPASGGISASNSGAVALFVIIASLALILFASSAFRFMMKRPDPALKTKGESVKKSPESKKSSGKSKTKKTRSQRRKNK